MIDPAKSPKLMDITYYEEEDRTKPHSVAKGIYELKGDQFVFAWGGPDDRPKTFDAKKGDGVWVLVYQRKKKGVMAALVVQRIPDGDEVCI